MKIKLVSMLLVAAGILFLASCVPLAIGAGAGYAAHEEGYRVRNPISRR
jgi:hypothetical protein